jgi:hypothetical protein
MAILISSAHSRESMMTDGDSLKMIVTFTEAELL